MGTSGVNCPYMWTNSTDEENHPGSACEGERQEKKPEELASLEAPDGEGEWCWSKRNRITRWRKRVEPKANIPLPLLTRTKKRKRLED